MKTKNINILIIFIFTLLLLFSCNSHNANFDENFAEVYVEFSHPYAEHVSIVYLTDDNNLVEYDMVKISDTEFVHSVDFTENLQPLFNIKIQLIEENSFSWVVNQWGINAKRISVGGILVNENNVIKFEDITPEIFIFFGETIICEGVEDKNVPFIYRDDIIFSNTVIDYAGFYLPELKYHNEFINYHVPPEDYICAMPWLQAVHLGNSTNTSEVQVKYLRLYAVESNQEVLIYEERFFNPFENIFTYPNGKLYLRYPFLYNTLQNNWDFLAKIYSNIFITYPYTKPDKIWRRWSSQRIVIPENAEYIIFETEVKLSQNVCLQFGLDFWKDLFSPQTIENDNHIEAAVSNPYFTVDSINNWQVYRLSTKDIISN